MRGKVRSRSGWADPPHVKATHAIGMCGPTAVFSFNLEPQVSGRAKHGGTVTVKSPAHKRTRLEASEATRADEAIW